MIELPEAVVLARQINESLIGKRIVQAAANASPHKFAWYTGDPANYQHLLHEKTIQQATTYGNHVEIRADELLLVISAPMRYHPSVAMAPAKHQLYLEFADHSAVSCTVQMWGAMYCFPVGEEGGLADYHIARQKPSPLSDAFDRTYFDSLYDSTCQKLSAKEFLATKQRIPGLGNGVLQDILWNARIHPRRKMESLSDAESGAMYDAVKRVLADMVEQGGRDTESDLYGRAGGYKTILSKNTVGAPCPGCGATIRKESFLGGAIYFCPGCQR
jgi:formamidopyrimidine-DNA glycosylase